MKQNEALEQIKYIRDMMDKATHRMFFSPWQWIEWGVLVLVAGIWTQDLLNKQQHHFILYLWIIVFIVGGTFETLLWVREANKRGIGPFNPFLIKIWGIAMTIFLIPIVFTPIFIQIKMPMYLPGLWLISTGVAIFTMVLVSARREILIFCELLLISGILSVSIFLEHSLIIATYTFGFSSILTGVYLFFKKPKSREEIHEN